MYNIIIILDFRACLTSNDTLCYIFCSLGLYKLLDNYFEDDEYISGLINNQINFGNGSEFKNISKLCPTSHLPERSEQKGFGSGIIKSKKGYSDIFEAIIGSIFLDGGFY